jgi:uncharacterized membrane protein
MSNPYLLHLLFGPLLLMLGLLFKAFPPRRINHLYGYRMPRAMVNQDAWDEANRYAANWLIYLAALVIGIQLITIFMFSPSTSLIIGAILMGVAAIAVMPITETHMARTFDDSGNRK